MERMRPDGCCRWGTGRARESLCSQRGAQCSCTFARMRSVEPLGLPQDLCRARAPRQSTIFTVRRHGSPPQARDSFSLLEHWLQLPGVQAALFLLLPPRLEPPLDLTPRVKRSGPLRRELQNRPPFDGLRVKLWFPGWSSF